MAQTEKGRPGQDGQSEIINAGTLIVLEHKKSRPQPQASLAQEINSAHGAAERCMRSAVEHAIRAGELLLEAKRTVAHGGWVNWIRDNIEFSERLAQSYIRLAKLPIEKRNAVADLPLRDALSAIRSREQKNTDARERAERPAGPAQVCTVGNDGLVLFGRDAINHVLNEAPARPPAATLTGAEVADEIIGQLDQVLAETGGDIMSADDLRDAFDRRFPPQPPAPAQSDHLAEKAAEPPAEKVRRRERLKSDWFLREASSITGSDDIVDHAMNLNLEGALPEDIEYILERIDEAERALVVLRHRLQQRLKEVRA